VQIAGYVAAGCADRQRRQTRAERYRVSDDLRHGAGPVIRNERRAATAGWSGCHAGNDLSHPGELTATLGGVSVPVTFAGLTPTLVGALSGERAGSGGRSNGNAIPLVITATGADGSSAQSNTVTIAVQ